MKIQHVTTIFAVSDLEASFRFYVGVLGFREVLRFDFYIVVQRDDCRIGLSGPGDPRQREPGTGEVYLVCDAVDEYHQRIINAGAPVEAAPQNQDYGMRDFVVRDPDGNVITFGARLTETIKQPGLSHGAP